MILPLHAFSVESINENDGYQDIYFVDSCRKSAMRSWRISRLTGTKDWYGVIIRADDAESEFNQSSNLPARAVAQLALLAEQAINRQ